MFYAYSCKQQKEVSAQSVIDLNDTFKCLNEKCNAELFLKSINGKRKAHFCVKPSKPHIQGCAYRMPHSEYVGDDFIKMSLDDIYHGHSLMTNHDKTTCNCKTNKQHSDNSKSIRFIRTPIGLLNFCMEHHLEDEYRDGLTVNDIILNHSNICDKANFEGISGLRLLWETRCDIFQMKTF